MLREFAVCLGILVSFGNVLSSDLVTYDLKTQSTCTEIVRGPRYDCRWEAGLNLFADQVIEGGRIIAYQIRWSNTWSGWLVPGVNDLDTKINAISKRCPFAYRVNTMRRYWTYFTDHTHKFIICKFA